MSILFREMAEAAVYESLQSKGSFIWQVCKIFRKTNISYPLIRTRTCVYQGVRNVSFSENSAYVQMNDS